MSDVPVWLLATLAAIAAPHIVRSYAQWLENKARRKTEDALRAVTRHPSSWTSSDGAVHEQRRAASSHSDALHEPFVDEGPSVRHDLG
jgi:hypothetical protein